MSSEFIVFIPVYNGFSEAKTCLRSVIENTSSLVKIIILDDCSPSGDFKDFFLGDLKESIPENLFFKRAIKNGGYVKAVNFAFKYAEKITSFDAYLIDYKKEYKDFSKHDVIVLNSDTIVTPNWSENLKKCAYSKNNVASVTPFSNNSVITSFPRFCRETNPKKENINQIASFIEKYSKREYPELPTAMGFCNYIRRTALEKIGLYDEENFGLGNGEENDFSLRARAQNLVCLLDDATYLYHVGEVSFAETKSKLENLHGKIINKLYPHYMYEISKYCSKDPNRKLRNNILDNILSNISNKKRILHIVNNSLNFSRNYKVFGGTELNVIDLVNNIPDYVHCSLSVHKEYFILIVFYKDLEREFIIPKDIINLEDLISSKYFNLVHVHHTFKFELRKLKKALLGHNNYIISLHDFNLCCPRNTFITPKAKFCDQFECQSSCGYSDTFINSYRTEGQEIFKSAKKIIAFSNSTINLYEKVLKIKINNFFVTKHGISAPIEKLKVKEINLKLDILILGSLKAHKGESLVRELIKEDININGVKPHFHILGDKLSDLNANNVTQYGSYKKAELENRILSINPHLILISSLCAETFSYTLEEALAFGIPSISSSIGAVKERVLKNNVGWVMEEAFTKKAIVKKLTYIVNHRSDYKLKVENALNYKLLTIKEESSFINEIYDSLIFKSVTTNKDFICNLKGLSVLYEKESNNLFSILARFSNYVVYILDYLGVRGALQKSIFKIFPNSFLERIKSAR